MLKSVYFIRCVENAFIAFVRINRCFCLHKHYVQFIEYWGPKRPGSGGANHLAPALVFSTHLISFLLRATKQERKSARKGLRHCVY